MNWVLSTIVIMKVTLKGIIHSHLIHSASIVELVESTINENFKVIPVCVIMHDG